MKTKRFPSQAWFWIALLTLTWLKLWLTSDQTLHAIGYSPQDDQHFVVQAAYLLRGAWLGPYDGLTLIKGPFFPAWIALAHAAGVPLLLSAQLLYAAACGLLTIAVRPLFRRESSSPILFAFLLFNPESAGVLRVTRQLITPAETLILAACAAGVLLAHDNDGRSAWWWAAGLGASSGALWLTREEQLVVLPFLFFLVGCALWLAWRRARLAELLRAARPWLVALLVWAAIVYSVAAVNLSKYGLFAKTE